MVVDREQKNLLYHEAQDRMSLMGNYYRWIARRLAAHLGASVLELGVGAGFVLRYYIDQVQHVYGVDYNPVLLERLGEAYPEDKVTPRSVDLRGDWHELGDLKVDSIIALDVLEHFEDDDAFAEKMARHLNPGGKAILKVPAQSELFSEMDVASGHYRRYDRNSLDAVMRRHGFQTAELGYMNVLGSMMYRLKRKKSTNFSKSVPAWQLRLANACIPAIAALDVLPLKGLSLVGVFARTT